MFNFEKATVTSDSFQEDGVLVIPNFIGEHKDLSPLFVPNNRAVPFYVTLETGLPTEVFGHDGDELQTAIDSAIDSSPNIVDLWKELKNADIVNDEFLQWDLLDTKSNIVLHLSQVDAYYNNALEISVTELNVFTTVLETAFEQDFVLSKEMYEYYMKAMNTTKQAMFDLFKDMGDNGSYLKKVEKVL
jgi:hypothetical protein